MTPLLVDSSSWIQFFSKKPDFKVATKIFQAKKEKRLATCGLIYLEVVRGARSKKDYQELSEEFQSMNWMVISEEHWTFATEMAFQIAWKGLHPPSTNLLIAAVAIKHKCSLLHQDRHFNQIAQFFPLDVDSSPRPVL